MKKKDIKKSMSQVSSVLDIDGGEQSQEEDTAFETELNNNFNFLIADVKRSMSELDIEINLLKNEMIEDDEVEDEHLENEDGVVKKDEFKMKYFKLKCTEAISKLIIAKQKYSSHLLDLYAKRKTILKKDVTAVIEDKDNDGKISKTGMTSSEIKKRIQQHKDKALSEPLKKGSF